MVVTSGHQLPSVNSGLAYAPTKFLARGKMRRLLFASMKMNDKRPYWVYSTVWVGQGVESMSR